MFQTNKSHRTFFIVGYDPFAAVIHNNVSHLESAIALYQAEVSQLRNDASVKAVEIEKFKRLLEFKDEEIKKLKLSLGIPSLQPNEVMCTSCTLINDKSSVKCALCGAPIKSHSSWECSSCTYVNEVADAKCKVCMNERPLQTQTEKSAYKASSGNQKRESAVEGRLLFEHALEESCCVVCMDGKQDAIAVPCGHNSCCISCAQSIMKNRQTCPICSQGIREVVRFFPV